MILISTVGLIFSIFFLFTIARDMPIRSRVELIPMVLAVCTTGGACAEFGLCVFSIHTISMFSKNTPQRYFPIVAAALPASIQLLAASNGYATIGIISGLIALMITGWILQRITGATLTWQAQPVFQRALGTRDLLAIAPLLLIMGASPIVLLAMTVRNSPAMQTQGSTIIYAAFSLLGSTVAPILLCYLIFVVFNATSVAKIRIGVAAIVIVVIAGGIESSLGGQFPWRTLACAGMFASWVVGVLIGLLAFYKNGFRVVWAKRSIRKDAELDTPFDQL